MNALPKLADLNNKSFDPFEIEKLSNGNFKNPYAVLREMQRKSTVHKGSYRSHFTEIPDEELRGLDHYTVLGYDTVSRVLSDPELFSSEVAYQHSLGKSFGRTVTTMDPPDHTRFRRIFQKAFLPNIVAKWGDSVVDPVVNDLIGNFLKRGEADLIEEFTHHYPFQVIYRQLKLDKEQAPIFHKLAIAQLTRMVGAPEGDEASAKLGTFFQAFIDFRRSNPGDDIVTHIATVEVDGERLPDEVVISFLRQLMNAGADTTYRGLSNLITALLTHPEQFDAIAKDFSLFNQAVDEAIRWEGPVSVMFRATTRDTEIDGVFVPKGALLNCAIASANRDETKYENPDEFNIFRDRRVRHIGFSTGPHVCIGQHLARVEMQRGLAAIMDKMPNIRLDPDKPAPEIIGHNLRVTEHLYVKFDKA